MNVLARLYADDAGFIVSGELVLVATILVIGMVVGLSELSYNVVEELEDVGSAIGAVNQSYYYSGARGHKGWNAGSAFHDKIDECDGQFDITCDVGPRPEHPRRHYR